MRHYISVLTSILLFILLCPAQGIAANQFVVVIDAGHGGRDVGTPHRKFQQDEKTVALNVATKLGKMIESKYPDVKIVYTRTTDVYPTLPDRTRIAREAKGNLFISIHVNAASDGKARGFETYVFGVTGLQGKNESEQKRIRERTMIERENLDIDGNEIDFENAVDIETKILCQAQREKHNRYSLEVAHYVQDNMMAALRKSSYKEHATDRGVKQKNIFVLCYSPMPAILVELGYMSNYAEEKFINSEEGQNLFASSIFKGFEQYRNNWERRQLRDSGEELPSAAPTASEIAQVAQSTPVVEEPQVEKPAAVEKPVVTETPKAQEAAKPQEPAKPVVKEQPKAETKPEQKVETKAEEKPVVKAEPKQEKKTETQPAAVPDGGAIPVVPKKDCFRIQILSSPTLLKKGDPKLKGMWPIYYYENNGYYRYTYGEGETRNDLQQQITETRKVFQDCFIVHFDANGQRVK